MKLQLLHLQQHGSLFQAIRFMMVGVLNTLVDIVVYFMLTRFTGYFDHHILITRIISFLSGSVCSFILNRIWTFEKRDKIQGWELLKFYVTVGMSLLIGLFSMQFFIKAFHLYDLIALAISIIFTFIWNFTISKFWVFKKKEESFI